MDEVSISFRCACHTLQLAIKDALDNCSLTFLFGKVREQITKFRKSNILSSSLESFQRDASAAAVQNQELLLDSEIDQKYAEDIAACADPHLIADIIDNEDEEIEESKEEVQEIVEVLEEGSIAIFPQLHFPAKKDTGKRRRVLKLVQVHLNKIIYFILFFRSLLLDLLGCCDKMVFSILNA